MVCCEALEIMTLCFALLPTALDTLSKEKAWQTYIIDLLLHCHSKYVNPPPVCLDFLSSRCFSLELEQKPATLAAGVPQWFLSNCFV